MSLIEEFCSRQSSRVAIAHEILTPEVNSVDTQFARHNIQLTLVSEKTLRITRPAHVTARNRIGIDDFSLPKSDAVFCEDRDIVNSSADSNPRDILACDHPSDTRQLQRARHVDALYSAVS
jgi:hypothetical protein